MRRTRVIFGLVAVLSGSAVLAVDAQQRTYTPSQADSDNYRGKPCNDPWINIAYMLQDNSRPPGMGTVGACDIQRYNNGRWQSFEDLRQLIYARRIVYQANKIAESLVKVDERRYRLQTFVNGQLVGAPIIGQDGASLIYDVAALIGKGGAGVSAIVAAGGGNIVAAGGGNIVAAGGGNMKEIAPGLYLRTVAR